MPCRYVAAAFAAVGAVSRLLVGAAVAAILLGVAAPVVGVVVVAVVALSGLGDLFPAGAVSAFAWSVAVALPAAGAEPQGVAAGLEPSAVPPAAFSALPGGVWPPAWLGADVLVPPGVVLLYGALPQAWPSVVPLFDPCIAAHLFCVALLPPDVAGLQEPSVSFSGLDVALPPSGPVALSGALAPPQVFAPLGISLAQLRFYIQLFSRDHR